VIVCHCFVIASGTLAEVVAAGASTPKQVAAKTKAGTQCGRCVATIRTLIDAAEAQPPP
jgi:bacterioferritin-associated ferredoxin